MQASTSGYPEGTHAGVHQRIARLPRGPGRLAARVMGIRAEGIERRDERLVLDSGGVLQFLREVVVPVQSAFERRKGLSPVRGLVGGQGAHGISAFLNPVVDAAQAEGAPGEVGAEA